MNASPNSRIVTIALLFALLASACTSATGLAAEEERAETTTTTIQSAASESTVNSAAESSTTSETPDISSDQELSTMLRGINLRYETTSGVWPGFEPTEHPTIVRLLNDDGSVRSTIAINHPDPERLGDATALETSSLEKIGSAHVISNAVDAERLAEVANFEFHLELGGVDSFVINAGGASFELNGDFPASLVHEMFHRWQDDGFATTNGNQDVDGYNYDKENIELAVLEQRALVAALNATNADGRLTATRHFAALRLFRRNDQRVVLLDDNQERYEGTARFMEHATATSGDGASYGQGDFASELANEMDTNGGIKDWFGFGRFYSSGAAAVEVARLHGVENALSRISADGGYPADLVIEASGVVAGEVDDLVAEARNTYDADGSVAEKAAEAKASAATEGDIFGGEDSGDVAGGDTSASDDAGEAITEEQIACLTDNGFDFDTDGQISDELFVECFEA